MKILAVGGGSGGHVTPVVAVLKSIKQDYPDTTIRFWCDTKFAPQARALMGEFDTDIMVSTIVSGKLRRYYHLSVLRQLLWPKLVLLNLRDGFLVFIGIIQSFVRLIVWRPDVIFTKGGYVCLPVGLAAKLLAIPLVIHDSDAHPGLTNRILGRFANAIATGAPLEFYRYPKNITRYVGIPIASEFHPFSEAERREAKRQWGLDPKRPIIVVTGGGLGAQRINDTIVKLLPNLLRLGSVVLVSGAGSYTTLVDQVPANDNHFQLHSFVSSGMASLLGAADAVITRAGATTILELSALAKPTILIPNAKLTGGHQLKNAMVYAEKHAVVVVNEEDMMRDPTLLLDAVSDTIGHPEQSREMAERFALFSKPHAAHDMADMIIAARRK